MMKPKERGERTQGAIIGRLVKCGIPVLLPFGDNLRYDLVIELDEKFHKVQCKTARKEIPEEPNVLVFNTCSQHCISGKRTSYRGQIDLFAVYYPELDSVYLIPVEDVGTFKGRIRLTERSDGKKVKLAKDYILDAVGSTSSAVEPYKL